MSLRRWRRLHGPDIVAQVEPIDGLGMWEPSAWRTAEPTVISRTPVRVERLTDAHAAADALARDHFGHVCDAACGEWCPQERRSEVRET
jgi:hypothetical protein